MATFSSVELVNLRTNERDDARMALHDQHQWMTDALEGLRMENDRLRQGCDSSHAADSTPDLIRRDVVLANAGERPAQAPEATHDRG